MKTVTDNFIKDLINSGVTTFFGVQGGACARIIESIVKNKGNFIPVLNEQSAGYFAHGYYKANRKVAGLVFTTGPGLTNGLSGIAACFYDNVPLIVLVGQVVKKLNIANKTNTKMVGFQEVQHLKVCETISDYRYKFDNAQKYLIQRKNIVHNVKDKVQIVEILDDVQRELVKVKLTKIKSKINFKKNSKAKLLSIQDDLKKSNNPLIILGNGVFNIKNRKKLVSLINNSKINYCATWGGQHIQSILSNRNNYKGLFGNHSPGIVNDMIKKTDLIISLGCSLLQHQAGKNYDNFAPNAKIYFINNNLEDCKRAKIQFGKRLKYFNVDIDEIYNLFKFKYNSLVNKISHNKINNNYPVNLFVEILKYAKKNNSIVFSDAGATLSWTFQGANELKNCPPVYTAFNLHAMGYANCAAVGAKISNKKKNILCIIGDGSLPMNVQELSWTKRYPIKLIIIDNEGYGIIRQTQQDFYKSVYYGSDFKNKKSSLPKFNIPKILNSYGIPCKNVTKYEHLIKSLNWLHKSNYSKALILKINYKARVQN
ncbi:MAG: hypothetical protein CL850_03725 [Crocinitomicaceae bacterium]|nr:hypothetical protein [Crocinitomicaceae bacterium]|tara:strand:- start:653 stop:2272 length:1620 start_codon:yes stop_codon:yes gene_type:complete